MPLPSSVAVFVVGLGRRPRYRCCGRRPARNCRCRTARPRLRSPLSPATMTRSGCMRPRLGGANRMRSLCPSLRPPSRRAGRARARIALISSGAAPRSRRIEPTVSPFFGDHDALVPVVAAGGCVVLRQQRDVLRHDARLEADIGIGLPVGGIAQLEARCRRHRPGVERAAVRRCWRRRARAP